MKTSHILLTAVLTLTLTACGGGGGGSDTETSLPRSTTAEERAALTALIGSETVEAPEGNRNNIQSAVANIATQSGIASIAAPIQALTHETREVDGVVYQIVTEDDDSYYLERVVGEDHYQFIAYFSTDTEESYYAGEQRIETTEIINENDATFIGIGRLTGDGFFKIYPSADIRTPDTHYQFNDMSLEERLELHLVRVGNDAVIDRITVALDYSMPFTLTLLHNGEFHTFLGEDSFAFSFNFTTENDFDISDEELAEFEEAIEEASRITLFSADGEREVGYLEVNDETSAYDVYVYDENGEAELLVES